MVERPIKKSDRQAVTESNDVVEAALEAESTTTQSEQDSVTPSPVKRTLPPVVGKDKTKGKEGKGRRNQEKDEQSSRPPANLALMRGPKPTKPKPPVVKETEEETTEDSVEQEES